MYSSSEQSVSVTTTLSGMNITHGLVVWHGKHFVAEVHSADCSSFMKSRTALSSPHWRLHGAILSSVTHP